MPVRLAFLVKHFSDTVEYSSMGFLEKNRDTVSKELVNVLRESDLAICRQLMAMDDDQVPNDGSRKSLGGRVVISPAKNMVSAHQRHSSKNIHLISFFLFF